MGLVLSSRDQAAMGQGGFSAFNQAAKSGAVRRGKQSEMENEKGDVMQSYHQHTPPICQDKIQNMSISHLIG